MEMPRVTGLPPVDLKRQCGATLLVVGILCVGIVVVVGHKSDVLERHDTAAEERPQYANTRLASQATPEASMVRRSTPPDARPAPSANRARARSSPRIATSGRRTPLAKPRTTPRALKPASAPSGHAATSAGSVASPERGTASRSLHPSWLDLLRR